MTPTTAICGCINEFFFFPLVHFFSVELGFQTGVFSDEQHQF